MYRTSPFSCVHGPSRTQSHSAAASITPGKFLPVFTSPFLFKTVIVVT
ncbi:Hypothetical protein Cp262_0606 [Corynebacterium pseudotuberculosis]|nr:Hypothetical protein Cp267_0635 [Corynebacterium pseudotuberculosis 267]AKP08272.2 Hypothetical protein Cp262_0606 [Corynebacterium pseudotuberculosis]APZ32760.1 Hypothetical protein CpMEX1_2059 [Corynebacterium pseudotuberculosis]ARS61547.1 Hypothetical protein CpATCC19410_2144 [Corynebacterium pseudotuberculosis]